MKFGQAYCMGLVKRNPRNFILYFLELQFIFYVFWKLKGIFGNLKDS
jgi:hypothetical protein